VFQIAELVEQEQRVVAGAIVVAVPDAVLLFAMRRAEARIHSEKNAFRRTASMNVVDPLAGKVGERRQVFPCRQPLRLKAAHLAGRGSATKSRLAADNPSHRWITAQTFGVVHVLVSGEAAKDRLPEHPGQCVATILAGAGIGKTFARHRRQTKHVVEFVIRQQ